MTPPSAPPAFIDLEAPAEVPNPSGISSTPLKDIPVPLSKEDQKFKALQESRVNGGFFEVADALYQIKTYKRGILYGSSFEEYVRTQFSFGKQHFYRLSRAGEFLNRLNVENVTLPVRESQVRPILQLPEDDQVKFWSQQVRKTSPAQLTAAVIAPAVKEYARVNKVEIVRRPRTPKTLSKDAAKKRSKSLLKALEKATADLPKARKIRDFISCIHDLI